MSGLEQLETGQGFELAVFGVVAPIGNANRVFFEPSNHVVDGTWMTRVPVAVLEHDEAVAFPALHRQVRAPGHRNLLSIGSAHLHEDVAHGAAIRRQLLGVENPITAAEFSESPRNDSRDFGLAFGARQQLGLLRRDTRRGVEGQRQGDQRECHPDPDNALIDIPYADPAGQHCDDFAVLVKASQSDEHAEVNGHGQQQFQILGDFQDQQLKNEITGNQPGGRVRKESREAAAGVYQHQDAEHRGRRLQDFPDEVALKNHFNSDAEAASG